MRRMVEHFRSSRRPAAGEGRNDVIEGGLPAQRAGGDLARRARGRARPASRARARASAAGRSAVPAATASSVLVRGRRRRRNHRSNRSPTARTDGRPETPAPSSTGVLRAASREAHDGPAAGRDRKRVAVRRDNRARRGSTTSSAAIDRRCDEDVAAAAEMGGRERPGLQAANHVVDDGGRLAPVDRRLPPW